MPSGFFSGRTVRNAQEFQGPRVYSTDLHPHVFSSADLNKRIGTVALSLKAKIITRGLVTINGAHFLSPDAIRFFQQHPDFIESSAVVTAFREDKTDFGDYVRDYEEKHAAAGISSAERNAHVDLLNRAVTTLLPWKLEDVGEKYRTLIIRGLDNPKSSIRNRLLKETELGEAGISALIQQMREEVNVSEDRGMQTLIEKQSAEVQTCLRPFTTTCYHIIGVDVVNCETGTDIQPLDEYKAEEKLRSDVEDSDYDELGVFRLVFELALRAIDTKIYPTPVLEALTFKDASQLGSRLHASEFAKRYESVIQQFAEGLKQKNDAAAIEQLGVDQLANDVEELSRIFSEEIDREFPWYDTQYHSDKVAGVVGAGHDLAGQIVGMTPIGNIQATYQAGASGKDLVENGWLAWKSRNQETAFKLAGERRDEELKSLIDSAKIGKKAPLLEAARLFAGTFQKRIGAA